MKMPRFAALALLVALLTLTGCDPHGFNSPEPGSLTFHKHTVILYLHTVNADRDTFGVRSISGNLVMFYCRRDEDGGLSRDYANIGGSMSAPRLVSPDTFVRQCTTSIDHYVTYQRRYGGDTTRYCQLDRYGDWKLSMDFGSGKAVTETGETTGVAFHSVAEVPDTVRQNGTLELDVTCDMDGLLTRARSGFSMNMDHVTVTQR